VYSYEQQIIQEHDEDNGPHDTCIYDEQDNIDKQLSN
jgi:hypothetical protein